jgi:hypothetical protein
LEKVSKSEERGQKRPILCRVANLSRMLVDCNLSISARHRKSLLMLPHLPAIHPPSQGQLLVSTRGLTIRRLGLVGCCWLRNILQPILNDYSSGRWAIFGVFPTPSPRVTRFHLSIWRLGSYNINTFMKVSIFFLSLIFIL